MDNEVNSFIIPGNGLQNLLGTFHTECFYEILHTLFTWQEKENILGALSILSGK